MLRLRWDILVFTRFVPSGMEKKWLLPSNSCQVSTVKGRSVRGSAQLPFSVSESQAALWEVLPFTLGCDIGHKTA